MRRGVAMSRFRVALALLLLGSVPAYAVDASNGLVYTDTAIGLTTSSSCPSAAAYDATRKGLTLDNTGGSINVGYCLIQPGQTSCTAAIGTAPTTTLAAGSLHSWTGAAPLNGFCFIAASGTPSIRFSTGK